MLCTGQRRGSREQAAPAEEGTRNKLLEVSNSICRGNLVQAVWRSETWDGCQAATAASDPELRKHRRPDGWHLHYLQRFRRLRYKTAESSDSTNVLAQMPRWNHHSEMGRSQNPLRVVTEWCNRIIPRKRWTAACTHTKRVETISADKEFSHCQWQEGLALTSRLIREV